MKKKILLTLLMLVMLISVFAVVVSAKAYICVDETTGKEVFAYEIASGDYPITSYSADRFAKYDSEGNALTWLRVKTTTLETGVVQYTVKAEKTRDIIKDNGDGILQSSEITGYSNIMSITFDDDCGITEFGQNSKNSGLFHKLDNDKNYFLFADIPDSVTKLSNSCFRNCIALIDVRISENSKLEDFGFASFSGCTSLRSIYIPKGIKTLKTDYVASEQYWDYGCFRNCQSLASVTFAEDSSLEVIEKCAFYMCYSLEEITLPNSVKTIHPRVFTKCTSLEYINFGGGLVEIVREIGGNDEYVSLFQNSNKIKTLVLPATFKAENLADDLHTAFAVYGKQYTIYYAGTEAEFVKLQNKFALATSGSGNKGIINATYNHINPCDAFYGGVHKIQTTLEYTDFSSVGYKQECCIMDGCTINDKTEAPALFTCLGYSVPENGRGSIAIGFTVNDVAIREYEEITGKKISYGVFAVAKEKLGTNDIFNKDSGAVANDVVNAEIESYQYKGFELKISGFTDDNENVKLALGAYVITTDGETTEYSYIQSGATSENEKYAFVSFNDVVNAPSDNEIEG